MSKGIAPLVLAASLAVALLPAAEACTRVLWNTQPGYLLSARNLDFFGPVSPSLVLSPRGVSRVGATEENAAHTVRWKARYGSVAVYADNVFPMDGMNEKGLVAHTLYFTGGAEQPQPGKPEKPVLESSHWLSFILDNHATVAEAVAAIRSVRLLPKRLPIDYASDTKHIAIEDASGDSAIIEIVKGETVIHHGRQFTVLTNPPDYDTMLKQEKKFAASTSETIPTGWQADARLVRANWLLKTLPRPDNVEEARGFLASIMHSVAMPIGLMADPLDLSVEKAYEPYSRYPAENRGVGTYWTTTADMKNMRYAFQSASSISPVWLDLRDFDFARLKQTKAISRLNLYGSKSWAGNARQHLQDVAAYH